MKYRIFQLEDTRLSTAEYTGLGHYRSTFVTTMQGFGGLFNSLEEAETYLNNVLMSFPSRHNVTYTILPIYGHKDK